MGLIHSYDISLSCCGVTIFSDDGNWIETTSIKTNPNETHAVRLKNIRDEIIKIREKYACKTLVCEQGFSRFSASTQAIFKATGVIQLMYCDVEQVLYPPTTVKKTITGKGNSKKDEVARILKINYPEIQYNNNDESDSFAISITYMLKNNIIKSWKKN